jgi:hypothetical protein
LKIIGYGEDALTLWALKQRTSKILEVFADKTLISECIAFYRPSFGRRGKGNSTFGEFDAIITSKQSVYLIESKWDNHNDFKNEEFSLENHQILRHQIFAWYLTHWNKKYVGNWQAFIDDEKENFPFSNKTIAPDGSLLAQNLEQILTRIQEQCGYLSESSIKNVFLFFYNSHKSTYPIKTNGSFKPIPIPYSREIEGNFVTM